MDALLDVAGVCKSYGAEDAPPCLENVTFSVKEGDFVVLMGPSGRGKSTLLNIMAGLIAPDAGSVRCGGRSIADLSPRELDAYRREQVGMVFQEPLAFAALTVRENLLVCAKSLSRSKDAIERVDDMIASFGLEGQADQLPNSLSVGQRRRLAAARCLLADPRVVLADEPTNDLDGAWRVEMVERLRRHAAKPGRAVVMVTHDERCAAHATRMLTLEEGGALR